MKIKKGSTVSIISGKHKNQKGKIISICKESNSVIIENVNVKTKHVKPRNKDEKGSIKKIEAPIHFSNIKIEEDKK